MSLGPSGGSRSWERNLERMALSLRAWQRAVGASAAGGAVLEMDQAVASVVPATPTRSMLNAAAGPRGMPWDRSVVDRLGVAYEEAGIRVWGIWVHEDDAGGLGDAGLVIDSRPAAMALDLSELSAARPADGVTVEAVRDLSVLAQPLGAGYGFPPELLTSGLPGLLDHTRGWVAFADGEPAAGLVIVDCDGDAGVFMVATAPEFRGRGAASSALYRALLHAREEGSLTSTLQSSAMGHSVYARLGYVDLGAYLLWERRP